MKVALAIFIPFQPFNVHKGSSLPIFLFRVDNHKTFNDVRSGKKQKRHSLWFGMEEIMHGSLNFKLWV